MSGVKSLSFVVLGVATASLLSLTSIASASTVNAFANGSFEIAGTTTPAEAWLEAGTSGYTRSTDAFSGEWSMQLMAQEFGSAVGLQNNVEDGGQPPLIVGDQPELSFWSKGFAGTTGNVNFALRFLDGTGNILYDSGLQFFQGSINESSWNEITFTPDPVPVGAVAAFIEFSQAIGPVGENNLPGTVLIDDVYLGVSRIPEPASIALVALGGVSLLFLRRRK